MATKRYRGTDRRILSKAKKCFQLIAAQDTIRADTTKKSGKISSRVMVFSPLDATLTAQVAAVVARIDACLAQAAP